MAQKCPTRQNAISGQPIEIFLPIFQQLRVKDFRLKKLSNFRQVEVFKYAILHYMQMNALTTVIFF